MKKISLLLLIILISLLSACGQGDKGDSNVRTTTTDTSQSDEVKEGHVRITVSLYDGEQYLSELEIPVEDGDLLLDVMKENFYVETNEDGTDITSIERMAESEEDQTNWTFTVNGDTPSAGVNEYELSAGDKVVFDLKEQ